MSIVNRMKAHVATDASTMEDIQESLAQFSTRTGFDVKAFYPEA